MLKSDQVRCDSLQTSYDQRTDWCHLSSIPGTSHNLTEHFSGLCKIESMHHLIKRVAYTGEKVLRQFAPLCANPILLCHCAPKQKCYAKTDQKGFFFFLLLNLMEYYCLPATTIYCVTLVLVIRVILSRCVPANIKAGDSHSLCLNPFEQATVKALGAYYKALSLRSSCRRNAGNCVGGTGKS